MSLDNVAGDSQAMTYSGHCTGSFSCRSLTVDTHEDSLSIDMTDLVRDGSHATLTGERIADPEGMDRDVYRLTTLISEFRHVDFRVGKFKDENVPDSLCTIERPQRNAALSAINCTYYVVNEFGDADPVIFGFIRSP